LLLLLILKSNQELILISKFGNFVDLASLLAY
jgi:hypothetical protein